MHFEDPYEILGLKDSASQEEIQAAYEKLMENEETKAKAQAAYDEIMGKAEEPKEKEIPGVPEEPAEEPAEEKEPDAPSEEETKKEDAPSEKPEEDSLEEKKEEKRATPGQIALGVAAVVVLAAVLAALILSAMGGKETAEETVPAELPGETQAAVQAETQPAETEEPTIPADGDPNNETCKGTYSASDEDVIAAADTVVASMEDYQLTNAQLQIYYWMGIQSYLQNSGPYAQLLGLDVSKPLDSQPCALVPGQSWQQFFLKQALKSWQNYQAMAAEAQKNGHEMEDALKEFLENLPDEMDKQAKENGFADGKAMLANNVGAGAEIEDYLHFMEVYNIGYGYFLDSLDAMEPADEDIEAYYTEHEAELLEGGISKDNKVASVRHILIAPEDPQAEDQWPEAESKAKEILQQFLSGDKTEESFGKLAEENTMDPGSQATGGLYQDFPQGQMVPAFDQWSFDEARQAGDTDIVKTDYGYHIMYFVSSRPVWQDQVTQVILQENANKLIDDSAAKYPMDIDYSSILLGELKAQ